MEKINSLGLAKTSLVLGLALILIAGIFLGYVIKPAQLPRKELPAPATKPIIFTQSSWGGSDKDLIAISALPPFEILKTWGPLDIGGMSMHMASFTKDDRYAYFNLGTVAPWMAKVSLSTLDLEKIHIGPSGGSYAMSIDEKYIYNFAEDTAILQKIDTSTGLIVNQLRFDEIYKGLNDWGSIRVKPGSDVHSTLMSPDGKFLYVTFQFAPGYTYGPYGKPVNPELAGLGINAAIWKIDLDKFQMVKKIDLGTPYGFHGGSAMSPDGKYIYGAGANVVYVVDAVGGEVVKRWEDGLGNHGVYMQPDGKYVWVSQGDMRDFLTDETQIREPEIWLIDTATNERVKRIPVPQGPHWIEFTPDSKYAASDADRSDYVLVWDVQKQELIKQIAVGNRAKGLDTPKDVTSSWHPRISPDGKYVYIAVAYADAMNIVDVEKGEVVKTIEVGPRPHQPQLFWPGYPYQSNWWTLRLPAEVPDSIDLSP